jgi:hypothetical protein
MMPILCPHKHYLRCVRARAHRYGGLPTDHRDFQVWEKLRALPLDAAYDLVVFLYDPLLGRPARDALAMLRSCLAMMLCGLTSFDEWVALMRGDPFYALVSGFTPEDVPGVGTFYDFQDRLLQQIRQPRTQPCTPYRRRAQQDKAPAHKDKLDLRPHRDVVRRLAERVLARDWQPAVLAAVLEGHGDFTALPAYERVLQTVFFACFVSPSVELQLVDLQHLYVAGDGTKLATWANPRGKKLCTCDNRGKDPAEHCTCHRGYRDPLARWGWDSYRECWVYGHSLYELTAYRLGHPCQLPVFVSLADCNRHDSVHALADLYFAREHCALPIHTVTLDAAHDAWGLYHLASQRWQMALVIPINPRHTDHLKYAGPLRLEDGVPVCPANLPMKRMGFCPDRCRIKWRCPLAASKKTPPADSCPFFANGCSGSPYGRVIYTYPEQNYRWHTLIPRGSPLWKLHQDARSCAERSVKRKKYDFHLSQTRTAGRARWFFRAILAAMCQHIDAWYHYAVAPVT